MSNDFDYEIDKYEAGATPDPVPPGWYDFHVKDTDMAPTKANDGYSRFLKVVYQIDSGEHKGKLIFDNMNLYNKSAKAEEIARGQFNRLRKALGVSDADLKAKGHTILRFKKGQFKLDLVRDKKETPPGAPDEYYDPKNVIKDVKPAGSVAEPVGEAKAPW